MDYSTKVTVLGRDHEAAGEIYAQALEPSGIAFGTSVGVTSKPNEDAIGVSVLGSDIVLAIADGHWGRDASELAVSMAVNLIREDSRPPKESETRARLFSLFEQINSELYQIATSVPGAPASETSLIVCHAKEAPTGKYLYWASFGDSYLFRLRNRELRQLNSLNPFWLGYLSKLSESAESKTILMRFLSDEARYVGVASGLETGIEKLQSGDLVFLCTDGLVGYDTDPDPSILEEMANHLASDLLPVSKVETLISTALSREETDNISCVLARIP